MESTPIHNTHRHTAERLALTVIGCAVDVNVCACAKPDFWLTNKAVMGSSRLGGCPHRRKPQHTTNRTPANQPPNHQGIASTTVRIRTWPQHHHKCGSIVAKAASRQSFVFSFERDSFLVALIAAFFHFFFLFLILHETPDGDGGCAAAATPPHPWLDCKKKWQKLTDKKEKLERRTGF